MEALNIEDDDENEEVEANNIERVSGITEEIQQYKVTQTTMARYLITEFFLIINKYQLYFKIFLKLSGSDFKKRFLMQIEDGLMVLNIAHARIIDNR